MLDIIKVADEYKIPIVADEVYYGLVFDEESEFHSFGALTHDVPVICCGAISKIYCVPGWRVGWAIVYNNHGYLDKVLVNLNKHSMI
jgi:tyrosine aminotransferase